VIQMLARSWRVMFPGVNEVMFRSWEHQRLPTFLESVPVKIYG
jgi:hypothetical protein